MKKSRSLLCVIGAAMLVLPLTLAGVLMLAAGTAAPEIETGVWTELSPEGAVSSDGGQVTTYIRAGTTANTMVLFCGGGISYNEYTAARSYGVTEIPDGFYNDNGALDIATMADSGLLDFEQNDLLADWNIIIIPYSTADYHIGTGEYTYTTLQGEEAVLYHHGYTNYRAIMDEAVRYFPDTEKLLIAGYSAGGFGAVMLADELIEDYFPQAQDITLCVDSALNLTDDWQSIAEEIWQAPQEIVDTMQSDDLVVDFMGALYEKYGTRINYLYVNSLHDGELARYQNYMLTGDFSSSNEQSEAFEYMLADMVQKLQRAVPTVGVYVYDRLPYTFSSDQLMLTQHTILTTSTVSWALTEDTSVMTWLADALNGDVQSYGLSMLQEFMENQAEQMHK